MNTRTIIRVSQKGYPLLFVAGLEADRLENAPVERF